MKKNDQRETGNHKEPTLAELEHAAKVMAKVVVMYGEDYLPIFMRLQREISAGKEAEKMKLLALELAKSYSDNG